MAKREFVRKDVSVLSSCPDCTCGMKVAHGRYSIQYLSQSGGGGSPRQQLSSGLMAGAHTASLSE